MDFELRDWCEPFARSLAESADDERVAAFLRDSFPHPYDLRAAHEFISFAVSETRNGNIYRAVVAENRAVGSVSLAKLEACTVRARKLVIGSRPNFGAEGS